MGTTQICLENEGMEAGGGGSRKSSKVIRRDHFSEITFKGGIAYNFTSFSPKSCPPPPETWGRGLSDSKEMYHKCVARAEFVVLRIEPIAFLTLQLPLPWSLLPSLYT